MFEYWNVFLIFVSAATSAFLTQLFTYIFVYRTSGYKSYKERVETLSLAIRKLKNTRIVPGQEKTHNKKMEQLKEQLKNLNTKMIWPRLKTTLVTGVLMLTLFGAFRSSYNGVVVAKLPFEPIKLVSKLSHRTLGGVDLSDCSFAFIMAVSMPFLREAFKRLGAFEPKYNETPKFFEAPNEGQN
ncbi:pnas-related [Anaeramoeba flamelloides]|uniref:Pnas-related n=1 Tax=Anaeramoeba flamelloides TaxID=1746091 RepID=A0ABQ8XKQ6_9EUKA|nr:pnas-related [Anaeramoeba flamelloides]